MVVAWTRVVGMEKESYLRSTLRNWWVPCSRTQSVYGPVVENETGGVCEIQKEVLSTLFSKHPKLLNTQR